MGITTEVKEKIDADQFLFFTPGIWRGLDTLPPLTHISTYFDDYDVMTAQIQEDTNDREDWVFLPFIKNIVQFVISLFHVYPKRARSLLLNRPFLTPRISSSRYLRY